jgi:hypothetical protein
VALLLVVGSLFALDVKLHRLQPELKAAQQQRYLAKQQADATARENQPSGVIGTPVSPPADTDEERRADRKKQIAIDEGTLYWTSVAARTGIASVIITALILAFQTVYTRQTAQAASLNAFSVAAAQRAWVTLHRLEIEIPAEFNGELVIAASLKNSGHSTARIVAVNVTLRSCVDDNGMILALTDIPDQPVYDSSPEVAHPAILVADETSTMRVSMREFDLLNSWHLRHAVSDAVWIYGYIHYTDNLTPKEIRRFGWARKFDRELSKRAEGGFRFRFAHVNKPNYNYAD